MFYYNKLLKIENIIFNMDVNNEGDAEALINFNNIIYDEVNKRYTKDNK